jgi:hypothetical protein
LITEPPQERYMWDSARVENCGPSRGGLVFVLGDIGMVLLTHADNCSFIVELYSFTC